MQTRVVMKFHPASPAQSRRLSPLVKRRHGSRPANLSAIKPHMPVFYDGVRCVGRRYRRQTSWHSFIASPSTAKLTDNTVTSAIALPSKQMRVHKTNS